MWESVPSERVRVSEVSMRVTQGLPWVAMVRQQERKQKQSTRDEGGEWALCSHLLCTVKEKSRQFEGRQTRQR
jgi:hypothetical protein